MKISFEIYPNFKFHKILYFILKINKVSFFSVPFNKKLSFNQTLLSVLFFYKFNFNKILHYHYNYSLKNSNIIKKISINNKINNILLLRGDFNFIKKKKYKNFFILFDNSRINFFSTFYTGINKNSSKFNKDILIFKKKIKKKYKIIFQQSFCVVSFLFFFELINCLYIKNHLIIGFFIFKNYCNFKYLTFNCDIFLNNWNNYCFSKNFKKKYFLFLFLFIKTLNLNSYKNIHFYTLNNFIKSYNFLKKIYEKNSSFRIQRNGGKSFFGKI
ncbi:hypothetical protein [Candidatus Vidania fulgoroideorum]